MRRQILHQFFVTSSLLIFFCLFFGLALSVSARQEGGPGRAASAAGEAPAGISAAVPLTTSAKLYLPSVMNVQTTATTSSAVLARPAANGQLGILAGLLVAGMLVGVVLVFSTEPEPTAPVQRADEDGGKSPAHSDE